MKTFIISALLISVSLLHGAQREKINQDWRFSRFGQMPDGSTLTEPVAPVATPSAESFADTTWSQVNLPHDWAIEGPFRMDLPNRTGRLPWAGIGWYRKALPLESTDQGKKIYLDFDGAMSQPKVYVNGVFAGEWAYGYSSFRIDITPHLKFGAANTIAVRLDNIVDSSRWYPGSGLYRNVWLVKAAATHFSYNGIFAYSQNINQSSADVVVTTEIDGPSQGTTTEHTLIDASGKVVASGKATAEPLRLKVKSPQLWDAKNPYLYTLRSTIRRGETMLDSHETRIGIRSAEWKADGFHLNGKRVQLNGVCNHHDLGALGSAFHVRAAERQLELLVAMGCNAIRTAHNPPAAELLDLCDRMGILVIDELYDTWSIAKKPGDHHQFYQAWHERDVANFVRRDRNHPCVIAWSTGNELPEQKRPELTVVSEKLTQIFRKHDTTRQTTLGINQLSAAAGPFGDSVDVVGLNYPVKDGKIFEKIRARKPQVPVLTSESSSCISSRGCYFFPMSWNKAAGMQGFQISSYEIYAPGWANRPDLDFELLEKHPYVAGEFVWTGFDYLGEPTPFNDDSSIALNFNNEGAAKKAMEEFKKLGGGAPSRSSYFGILDLAGFPKDRYYLYQAHWRPDFPMAHILPHWNWQDRLDKVTPVHVFTSGDEAELFLNGKSLGRKKKAAFQYRMIWEDVVYQPGTLTVKAWKNGKPWAEADRSTTGKATQIIVTADRKSISADGEDLSYITISVADEKGRLVPESMQRMKFQVSGAAAIVGVCNGDPTSLESMKGTELPAFNGLCQVILRSKAGQPGDATLTVNAEGLPAGSLMISCK
jgi:beta-galactosidase